MYFYVKQLFLTPISPSLQAHEPNKNVTNTFLLVLGYGLFFYALQFFLFRIGMVSFLPEDTTLGRWDATIYYEISQIGYKEGNVGSYVLLPWVWKLLHVGYYGMSIVNIIFFAAGFTIITYIYPISSSDKLLWLSTPSLYFMFAPYSEAVFFLCGTIVFYGLSANNKWVIWIGLFLISLSRATAVFLLPSMLAMELLTNSKQSFITSFIRYLVYYATPVLIGTAIFIYLQYYSVGIWFAYFKRQTQYLEHKWNIPVLPFSNFYGSNRIMWLSAFALLVCFLALVVLLIKGCKWLFKNKIYTDKVWILTLAYMPVIMVTMIFCNPTWGTLTTNLLGIHRYTFCSPFIFVMLHHLVSKPRAYKVKHFIVVILLCNIVWLSAGAYVHIQAMLFYNFITLLVIGYMVHANKTVSWVGMALFGINFFFQVMLFQQYLSGAFTD